MVDSDEERESKRLKLEMMPGIASGIISASKSAAYEESVALQINPEDCDLSEFFESESNDEILAAARNYDTQQTCLDAFNCMENNEDALRNAFFTGLQKQDGFHFPEGAVENNCGEYKEMELKALFKKFGEQFNEDVSMYDKEQGLLVTTTSKPDLCVLRKLPGGKTEVKFGEVKHGKSYTKESASRQGFLYLYSLLYFFRVKLGIPVDAVYGFVICGPKCQQIERNEYAVGLLKLSSPSGLGDNFVGRQYIEVYKTSDSTGLQLLAHFFTNGKVSNVESALQDQRDQGKRAPCLFAVPRSLWKDQDGPDGRELKLGGTCAMVFHLSINKLVELLEEVSQSQQNDNFWQDFIENDVQELQNKEDPNKPSDARKLYVKVRTRDTATHFEDQGFYAMYKKLERQVARGKGTFSVGVEDFFKTYITPPYGCDIFTLCIMADRGARFDYKKVDRNKLHGLLRDLKVKTLGMAKLVFHGDALVHNVVHNESSDSLHLIDFDEGTLKTKKVPRRSLNFTSDYPWYEALLYPNALRRAGESYTTVQFAASVLLFVMGHQGDGDHGDGVQRLMKLREKAEDLGEKLRDSDLAKMCWKDETAVPDHVKKLVQELDVLVDGLLQTEYGDI